MGVDVVARAIETMLGGRTVTRYKRDAEQFDVIVQTEGQDRTAPEDIDTIHVRGKGDVMVPLSSLVSVRESVSRASSTTLVNAARPPSRPTWRPTIRWARPWPSWTARRPRCSNPVTPLNSMASRASSAVRRALWASCSCWRWCSSSWCWQRSSSFIDPLVIMLSVPLSMVGALLALQWSGGSINVYSQIGLITLVGLITKHGILIVEFTNQLREQGWR